MTQKERLVELLHNYFATMCINDPITSNGLADHLLSNGVIVPPYKVGDEVYVNIKYLLPDGGYRTEGPVVGRVCSICFHKDGNEIEIEGDDPYFEKASIYRSSADFGNNVFLTKEEAEQALKEREK